jgi:2-polyprenyl-3-methyl-5-hydroxy-6-metoxy-1,4-benzoquinol methylase
VNNNIYTNVSSILNEIVDSSNSYDKKHLKRYGRTLSVLLDQKPLKGKLLEIGTSGVYPLVLQELVPDLQVHVTDYDLTKAPKGTTTLTAGERSRKVPVYRLNIETTPLPVGDETFDYIICGEVIEHLEQDPMFMMSEINRVLKTGGKLVLTTPNIASARGITRMLRGHEPYFYMQYRKAGTLDRHNYEYSPHSLAQVMKASGFKGSIWTEDNFAVPSMLDIEMLQKVGHTLTQIGDNIFSVGTKVGPVVDRYPSAIYSD